MRWKRLVFCVVLSIIFVSCSSTRKVLKSETNKSPAKLAILPIDNYTNDVNGSRILREVIYKTLLENSKGYEVQDIETTDALLRDVGITDGGQLKIISPIEISEVLGVDGLLYLKLDQMELLTLPFYHVRRIDCTYGLYNLGKLVREKPILVANRFVDVYGIFQTLDNPNKGGERALKGMAIGQGVRFVTAGIAEHELKPEMYMVSTEILSNLPKGSADDKGYLKEVENTLEDLRKKVREGKEISPSNKKELQYEDESITEKGITLF